MTLQAPPFGRDTSATTHVHHGRVVSGTRLVAEAALRRLITERGSLQSDLSYGLPIVSWLGSTSTEADRLARAAQIRSELLKDPRLAAVGVVITPTGEGPSRSWEIDIDGTTADGGTFDLAISASEVSFTVLRLEAT